MADKIQHQGIIEDICGPHVYVRIVQSSACVACSVKGHCSASDSKEKIIDVIERDVTRFRIGDEVCVVGEATMGLRAVAWAFVYPFILLVAVLFVVIGWRDDELCAALAALAALVPYYSVLYGCRKKFKKDFAFTITKIE